MLSYRLSQAYSVVGILWPYCSKKNGCKLEKLIDTGKDYHNRPYLAVVHHALIRLTFHDIKSWAIRLKQSERVTTKGQRTEHDMKLQYRMAIWRWLNGDKFLIRLHMGYGIYLYTSMLMQKCTNTARICTYLSCQNDIAQTSGACASEG